MDGLGDLADSPGRHRVCGRECSDGSPCQNIVERPGDTCWIESHRPEDPRVDGGPSSPDDVPMSGSRGRMARAGIMFGKGLAAAVVAFLGLGWFVADILIHAGGVLFLMAFTIGLDAYQRRTLSEDKASGE